MNEDQAQRMIELLEEILRVSKNVDRNTDKAYDSGDVCSRLDDVVSAIETLDNSIERIEKTLDEM